MTTATYTETAVIGEIKPLASGTRMRDVPTTKGAILIHSLTPSSKVEVDRVRRYASTDAANYVTANDIWAHVVRVDGKAVDGWTAQFYQRVSPPQICAPAYTIVGDGTPPPPPPPPGLTIVGLTVIPRYSDGSEGAPVKMVLDEG
jgi:hypothetical protein